MINLFVDYSDQRFKDLTPSGKRFIKCMQEAEKIGKATGFKVATDTVRIIDIAICLFNDGCYNDNNY